MEKNNDETRFDPILSSDSAPGAENTGDEEFQGSCFPCSGGGSSPEGLNEGGGQESITEEAARESFITPPSCYPGKPGQGNCYECCQVITDPWLAWKFGYQEEEYECTCHDICVQEARLICVKKRTITIPNIPGLNGAVSCRGGVEITALPTIENVRVYCADESLRIDDRFKCLVIDNEVGLEVTLHAEANPRPVNLVYNVVDRFPCWWYEFYRFPDGKGFSWWHPGPREFREEIEFIDGSCKTIIIEDYKLEKTKDCWQVVVNLKVIDKLWKHENLLVSAIRPYPYKNITVKREFEQHQILPCDETCQTTQQ